MYRAFQDHYDESGKEIVACGAVMSEAEAIERGLLDAPGDVGPAEAEVAPAEAQAPESEEVEASANDAE